MMQFFPRPVTSLGAPKEEEEEEVTGPPAAMTEEQLQALKESKPILVRWMSPQSQCVMGKPPIPRRSFSLLPLNDEKYESSLTLMSSCVFLVVLH